MPVQTAEGRFVQFGYAPDSLTCELRRLRADGRIGPWLTWLGECWRSRPTLDGGNIVVWNDRAIADKIFRENPGMAKATVVEIPSSELELSELIVVPQEPYDPIAIRTGWRAGRTSGLC
jgi:agmatine deiminase